MIPYFVVFGILAVFAILDVFDGGQELRKRTLFLFFVILCFFATMNIGDQDHWNYVAAFHESKEVNIFDRESMQGTLLYNMEPGYRVLNKIVSFVTEQSFYIFLIMAFVALSLNFTVFRKYSPYVFLSILLYFGHPFLLKEMIQIRVGVACALCLYSLCFVDKGRPVSFIFIVALAGMFHTIAWTFLVVYPLYKLNVGRNNYVAFLVISLFVALFFPLGQLFSRLSFLPLFEKINLYVNYDAHNQTLGVFTNPMILKNIVLSILGLYFFVELSEKFQSFKMFFLTYVIGTCWSLLFNDFSIIAARVSSLFISSEVIIIPMYFYLLRNNLFHRMMFWFVLVCYCFVTVTWDLYGGTVSPYQFNLF